jgi:hypothetical protein
MLRDGKSIAETEEARSMRWMRASAMRASGDAHVGQACVLQFAFEIRKPGGRLPDAGTIVGATGDEISSRCERGITITRKRSFEKRHGVPKGGAVAAAAPEVGIAHGFKRIVTMKLERQEHSAVVSKDILMHGIASLQQHITRRQSNCGGRAFFDKASAQDQADPRVRVFVTRMMFARPIPAPE